MRVLWVTGNFLPLVGGLEVYIDRAISSLAYLCSVRLITQHRQGPPTDERVSHFPVPNLSRPATQADWDKACGLLQEQVEGFAPDIVHFANAGVCVYRDALPSCIPTVATVHGNDLTAPWQWVPGSNALECIVASLSRCDLVFAVSSYTASLVSSFGVSATPVVITAGCDTEFFTRIEGAEERIRDEYGIPRSRPILLTVGRLVPRKGHNCILEAIASMGREVHWLVVGDGPKRRELLTAVEQSPVGDRITFLGHVDDETLCLLYSACSLFVLVPEQRQFDRFVDSEGFGLVFQEAGACGAPVIGSDVSGCRDAVVDGATGLLVPPGDPAALAAAMTRILDDDALARRLGAGAQSFVRASGGWQRFARQTLEHYEELTGKPGDD